MAKIIRGIISLVLGLGVFLWAREHSPNMGFGEMLTKLNSYMIQPTVYNIILIICALLAINGVVMIVLGLQANQKKD